MLPRQIDLADFQQTLTNVGYYIDVLRAQSITNPQSITVDIPNKQIIIDETPYPVTIKP
ncbi:MAG: hypothetical protein ACOYN2_02920 [Patescibacteria group bacterium]